MDNDDSSIERYLSPIIRAVSEAQRPGPEIVCAQGCPKANWFRQDQELRCYCHSMHVLSWPRLKVEDCLDRRRALDA